MTNIDRAAELLWLPETHLSDSECDDQARELAQALADAGLLTPAPQIIRTVEELEALDPDTVIQPPMDELGLWPSAISARSLAWSMRAWNLNPFPAAVLATAAQVRAARTALEEA